jgi:hypothetical protein
MSISERLKEELDKLANIFDVKNCKMYYDSSTGDRYYENTLTGTRYYWDYTNCKFIKKRPSASDMYGPINQKPYSSILGCEIDPATGKPVNQTDSTLDEGGWKRE